LYGAVMQFTSHDDKVVGYNIDWESWATYLLHTLVYGDSHWL
jgi:hypothetical protein